MQKESTRSRVENFVSPRINAKLSIVTAPNVQINNPDSEASTPQNRVRSAILTKSQTAPNFLHKM